MHDVQNLILHTHACTRARTHTYTHTHTHTHTHTLTHSHTHTHSHTQVFEEHGFMLLGQAAWSEARQIMQKLLSKDEVSVVGAT